jgi:hypothetical protein
MKAVERAGGRTGGGGKRGDLGRAEMLKTETLKGRMLRWTPGFGGIWRFYGGFHSVRAYFCRPLCQDFFGSGAF